MAAKTAVAVRPKIPMDQAALALVSMCDALEAAEQNPNFNLDTAAGAAVIATFNEARIDLAEAVDRRIAWIVHVEGQIAAARAAREAWDKQKGRLEGLLAAMKARTKEIVEASPDLPYKGALGRLAVQKNGGPAPVVTAWGDKELTDEEIADFGIDEAHFEKVTTYKLKTDVVRKELEAGAGPDWAQLGERGVHLRIKLDPGVVP